MLRGQLDSKERRREKMTDKDIGTIQIVLHKFNRLCTTDRDEQYIIDDINRLLKGLIK